MIDHEYIASVLARFEGKALTRGYIPRDRDGNILGKSGVTIATGLDLGQQSLERLVGMGVPRGLAGRLVPYLGLTGAAAARKLTEVPLVLSDDAVAAIDKAVHAAYIDTAAELFGRDLFETSPREVQAVATSLHYQFGTPNRASSPALGKAWSAMRFGRYAEAAMHLRDTSGWSASHRQYMRRRKAEADLLERAGL